MTSDFEWDEEKSKENAASRGLPFSEAINIDLSTAIATTDKRFDYGEDRLILRGMIGNRLHMLVYVMRGDKMRIISLRKANSREQREYGRLT